MRCIQEPLFPEIGYRCTPGHARRCARAMCTDCQCACGGANHGAYNGSNREEAHMRISHYEIDRLLSTAHHLVIRDLGPWDQFLTVTNNAAHVVAELVATGALRPAQRLLYFDSEGRLDEIVIAHGRFAGFAPIDPAGEAAHP